jgi:DNA-directed RNA polymerase alpha subunit
VKREEVHARYRQVLAWHRQGQSFEEIAERWGLARQRVHDLYQKALRWEAAVEPQSARLTAESSVEALHVTRGAVMGLRRRGLTSVGQVAALSDDDLLSVRNVGLGTVAAIRADLAVRYQAEPDGHDG